MQQNRVRIEGFLLRDGDEITIIAEYASKYSLFITCREGDTITHGAEFRNLSLKIAEEDVDLGQCRMLLEQVQRRRVSRKLTVLDQGSPATAPRGHRAQQRVGHGSASGLVRR